MARDFTIKAEELEILIARAVATGNKAIVLSRRDPQILWERCRRPVSWGTTLLRMRKRSRKFWRVRRGATFH